MSENKDSKKKKINDKQVVKPAGNRFMKNSKKEVSGSKKLADGGNIVENVSCRLVTYDIHGSNDSGFYVNQIFSSEKLIEFPFGTKNDKIIDVLKQQGILTDKASPENIKIEGSQDYTLFFTDSNKGMPLFELQNIENYEKKSDGGSLQGSELLSQEYFKTTAPIRTVPSTQDVPSVGQENLVNTQVQSTEQVKTEEPNPSGDLILPDYDNSNNQESILRQHLVGNEIHESHFEQILQRKAKYEEVVGTLKLRKCFLKPYYKII